MQEKALTAVQMLLATGAGWVVSLEAVEAVARIVSLIAPVVFSTILFVRKSKKDKDN
ncbi:hypothetical protein [Lishizhenia sp.]|uniref:hypothetical protein n=1 Tax=Lishizhenia sp. TaxID=2497594 RepID=UPI00299CF018|nr:hypothetical protein [Lishizhenia sp.]MDX1447194.1 hypothetical protein [Lishizhenia sp.]